MFNSHHSGVRLLGKSTALLSQNRRQIKQVPLHPDNISNLLPVNELKALLPSLEY